MTGTSSANPAKLAQFASDGRALGHGLAGKASALRTAVDELTAAGESVPGLTGFAAELEDLAYDWLHLDGFAGKVAQGFADHLVSGAGGIAGFDLVVSVSDATIAAGGEVGLADRGEAIARAETIARRLEELTGDEGASADDIAAILGDAERAMHDPVFAVTLSEALGVDGYVDVVGTIREVHDDESGPGGIDAALADVAVLGTILTTSLGQADRYREDRAPDDLVLDQSFVDELTHGYPGNIHDGYEHLDLSVLVAHTDPPTDIAVEIANHRISPFLDAARSADVSDQVERAWGDDRSGVVTNYTEMLARNADASAAWRVGAVQGIVIAAENNAVQDHLVSEAERQQAMASGVNFLVGIAPYVEHLPVERGVNRFAELLGGGATANDLADINGSSAGQLAFRSDVEDIITASEDLESRRVDEMLAGNVVSLAVAKGRHAPEGPTAHAMSDDQLTAFLEWLDESYDGDEAMRSSRETMSAASNGVRNEFRPG